MTPPLPFQPVCATASAIDRIQGLVELQDVDAWLTKEPQGVSLLLPMARAINAAWALLVAISANLIAWLRIALTPELAKAETKALRYRPRQVLAGPHRREKAQVAGSPANWPWATAIVKDFAKIAAIPAPG